MCGKEGLCNIGQKRNEKKEKKEFIFTCMPANEAMAAAGLTRLEGQSTVVGIMYGEAGV